VAVVPPRRHIGYWEREIQAWDIAAGLILVKEAGGLVGSLGAPTPGEGNPIETGRVIAANAELFNTFAGLLGD
ncbi:MAG: inositol monophosphatase family protein, partial [Pseudomonadota bacterium]